MFREQVGEYETEFIEFLDKDYSWCLNNKHKTKIILIPGNPGLIKCYDSFLDEVHRLQHRTVDILGVSHANHFLSKKSSYIYTLDQQIQHKK